MMENFDYKKEGNMRSAKAESSSSRTYSLSSSQTVLIPSSPAIKSFHDPDLSKVSFTVDDVGDLRALAISQEAGIWIGGTNGAIASLPDVGSSWRLHKPAGDSDLDFRALCIVEGKTVCAMSAGVSQVYRTEDGGENWSQVLLPAEKGIFFNAMKFWDSSNGIILCDPIGDHFAFYVTADGGRTWSRLIHQSMPFAMDQEAAFAASNSCLTVGGSQHVWFCTGRGACARVFYSADRGQTWDVSVIQGMCVQSPSAGLFSIAFQDESNGVAVGGDYKAPTDFPGANVFSTSDGGRTWNVVPPESLSPSIRGRYLSSAAYGCDGQVFVIDGSQEFNSIVLSGKQGCAVGPNQRVAIFEA